MDELLKENSQNSITLSASVWKEFQTRLNDAETHRKGLLEHAHNLEHLLNEAAKHNANLDELLRQKEANITAFLQHIENQQHLLQEKDSDLQQTKIVMKKLEARVYQLEQKLQEYGRNP